MAEKPGPLFQVGRGKKFSSCVGEATNPSKRTPEYPPYKNDLTWGDLKINLCPTIF